MYINKNSLTVKILVGMLAGVLFGALLRLLVSDSTDTLIPLGFTELSIRAFVVDGLLHAGGQIFVISLKMLVVPLVFVSLVCGVSALSDPKQLGRLGGKSIALYLTTTAMAISVAIVLALFIAPGEGVNLTPETAYAAKAAPPIVDTFVNMFPSNPIAAMAEGNMLQIIVFALLFGVALTMAGDTGKPVSQVFTSLNEVNMKMVGILMSFAPYGVFCLMAKLFTYLDWGAFGSLIKYFFVVLAALFIHALINYPLLLKLLSGLNPVIFLTKMREAVLFAFSTSSSNATIPVTLSTVKNKMGVNNSVASFTVPMGATINMDGTAIMQGVATVFIAQLYGIDLTVPEFLTVILTATLASIGTAGVPGVGLIMLAMVLQQVNLPVEGIALIIGVDRLLDMTRTAVNVTGDCMVTCVVAKSEGELNQDTFEKATTKSADG